MRKKTFRIVTLGCKVNQYDSQDMREKLLAAGLVEAAEGAQADICLVNTCTVTGKADKESLYSVRRLRRENPRARVVVTGCLAQRDAARIAGADLILPNPKKKEIARALGLKAVTASGESITSFKGHSRAFLKIQDGCDNFCSYCKVPFVRGRPESKPLENVAAEAQALAENGYREIVLTGICLGSYGKDRRDGTSLVQAVEAVEKIGSVARIRLSSIEAMQVTAALRRKLKEGGKLCPHLHVPLQSGDDAVLKRMNRPYTFRQFLSLIRGLQKTVKDFSFTTDIMVGFPGETEREFRSSIEAVRKLKPLKTHIFPFSAREGTRAASLPGRLPMDEIKRRVADLAEAARKAGAAARGKFIGRRMEVLVETRSKHKPGFWEGYTANYLPLLIKCRGKVKVNSLFCARLLRQEGESIISACEKGR